MYATIAFSISRKFMPFVGMAENIFQILGWHDVKRIDLPAKSKSARKAVGTLYFKY